MIPSALASSASPATPVLNSVVQSGANAKIASTWGLSYSPVSGAGTIEVETSPDNSTWTSRTLVSGLNAAFPSGTQESLVSFIATGTYYRIRQVLFGATSNWSSSVQFTATLATEPITPPTSVVITDVTRPFPDRYRVFFTVTQPGAISGFSGVGLKSVITYSSFSQTDVSIGDISSGTTNYEIDILSDFLVGAKFQVTVSNQAGGYESTTVSSDLFPEDIPALDETITYSSPGVIDVDIPIWATNFDYWIIGGSGGGGSGKVTSVSNNESISLFYVGEPGLAGTLQSGNLALPITELNVLLGTGGTGAERLFNEDATAGTSSFIRSGTTPVITAAGGAGGANQTSVTVPSAPSAGNASANVTIDGTTTTGKPGVAPQEGGGFPFPASDANLDSSAIVGGAGGGYAWPDAGLSNAASELFYGGNGGLGYCKLRFRNY